MKYRKFQIENIYNKVDEFLNTLTGITQREKMSAETQDNINHFYNWAYDIIANKKMGWFEKIDVPEKFEEVIVLFK